MIRAAIKSWILNLKTCLLSVFFQSLENNIHPLVGFKEAGRDRMAGKKADTLRRPAIQLLRFKFLTTVASNPRQISHELPGEAVAEACWSAWKCSLILPDDKRNMLLNWRLIWCWIIHSFIVCLCVNKTQWGEIKTVTPTFTLEAPYSQWAFRWVNRNLAIRNLICLDLEISLGTWFPWHAHRKDPAGWRVLLFFLR